MSNMFPNHAIALVDPITATSSAAWAGPLPQPPGRWDTRPHLDLASHSPSQASVGTTVIRPWVSVRPVRRLDPKPRGELVDRDQLHTHDEETTRMVQGWLAGLPSSITRLLARAGRAPGTTVHLMEARRFTGTVPLSDTTDPCSAWPQR